MCGHDVRRARGSSGVDRRVIAGAVGLALDRVGPDVELGETGVARERQSPGDLVPDDPCPDAAVTHDADRPGDHVVLQVAEVVATVGADNGIKHGIGTATTPQTDRAIDARVVNPHGGRISCTHRPVDDARERRVGVLKASDERTVVLDCNRAVDGDRCIAVGVAENGVGTDGDRAVDDQAPVEYSEHGAVTQRDRVLDRHWGKDDADGTGRHRKERVGPLKQIGGTQCAGTYVP
jgi:hypothetical protein